MKKLLSNSEYHNDEAIGSSLLKRINSKSVYHAVTEEFKVTESMVIGSALHCTVLEPEQFAFEFAVAPQVNRRTNKGKEEWKAFCEKSEGKEVLTLEQAEKVKAMKDSILSHDIAKAMLSGGESEYSYFCKDNETGLDLKCRPDYHSSNSLIDIKTCTDASVIGFTKAMANFNYHMQAAFYLDVFNNSQGTNYNEFYFIAVENKAPHAVAVYRLDEFQIQHGRNAYRAALSQYSEFLKSEKEAASFGYPQEIVNIEVPLWKLNEQITA